MRTLTDFGTFSNIYNIVLNLQSSSIFVSNIFRHNFYSSKSNEWFLNYYEGYKVYIIIHE